MEHGKHGSSPDACQLLTRRFMVTKGAVAGLG